MNDALRKILKEIKGNALLVGINNQYVLDAIYKNKDLVGIYSLDRAKLFNKQPKTNTETVKLRKLKKKFKDGLDYMICDANGINIDLRRVMYNTYTLIGKEIIYYGVYDEYDVDRLAKKYERYNCKVDKKIYDDSFILRIKVKDIKVTKLFLHKITDTFNDIVEVIGNLLMS